MKDRKDENASRFKVIDDGVGKAMYACASKAAVGNLECKWRLLNARQRLLYLRNERCA